MTEERNVDRRQMLALGLGSVAVAGKAAQAQTWVGNERAPDLSGKSILVTGTSSGFGKKTVRYLARRGAKVIATMRNLPRREANYLAELTERHGWDVHILEIDVTSDEQVEQGVNATMEIVDGRLDVLVNNAGIGNGGPVEVQDLEMAKLTMDTNFFGYYRTMRAVLPHMRAEQSGLIVNISSQLGQVVAPNLGIYPAAKHAVEGMSEQLAYEVVQHGIDITLIQPGGYPTRIVQNTQKLARALKERTSPDLLSAYPILTALMDQLTFDRGPRPIDVPRAVADLIAMPAGTRPLRVGVHPDPHPQALINSVSSDSQVAWLGQTPYGPWVKAVHQR